MNYNAANEFLATRLSLPTELSSNGISESLPPAIRAHCFFSARVAEARVLEELRSVSDQYSAGKLGLAEGRKVLAKWLDAHAIGDPKSARMSNIASSMRLDLILRQNAAMAAAVGRYQVSRDPDIEERWPCWRYIAGHNPRPEHKALDGKVIRKDDPFWHSHYPPWDFNCNCDVEDSDEKPDPTPQHDDHAPASGFQFDPAHAFEEFDLLQINDKDLQDRIMKGIEARYPGAMFSVPVFGKIDTGYRDVNKVYRSFARKAPAPLKKLMKKFGIPPVEIEGNICRYMDGKIYLSPRWTPLNAIHEWAHHLGESIDLKNSSLGDTLDGIYERIRSDKALSEKFQRYLIKVAERKSKYERTVWDIFGAISRNKIGGGHSKGYWTWEYSREREIFAQLTVLYGRQAREWKELQELIPELGKSYQELISNGLDMEN